MEIAPLVVEVAVPESWLAVVRIGGELDVDTATKLHHQLANQIAHGRKHLVLDMEEVPFMDSSGLNIVLRVNREVRLVDGTVRIAAPTSAVRRLLELTGVNLNTPVHDTVEQAVEAARADSLSGATGGLPDEDRKGIGTLPPQDAREPRDRGESGGVPEQTGPRTDGR
ncbi:STAS domain-containing protein [Streptomyces sp. ICBB 8177]|uniref:STAS domain-containing protein n=1 Tax=Streptomyces sp. ICBB 8177 TaxID=563922 RepID=UPI000D67D992|nr:anti-anti-sigma factor [Streptomyces sp. ICBB 8177]